MKHIAEVFTIIYQAMSESRLSDKIFLKPLQLKCLDYVYRGFDLVAVLPTGYGKSMIFQLLPFVLKVKQKDGLVIIIVH